MHTIPMPGDVLQLYLAPFESRISAILIWKIVKDKLPIYYVSKRLYKRSDTVKLRRWRLLWTFPQGGYSLISTLIKLRSVPLEKVLTGLRACSPVGDYSNSRSSTYNGPPSRLKLLLTSSLSAHLLKSTS